MADLRDDYDHSEAMMNIINSSDQYSPNLNEADPDFDDRSQYLIFHDEQENPVQENAGKVFC
jgi:hypothetical protein